MFLVNSESYNHYNGSVGKNKNNNKKKTHTHTHLIDARYTVMKYFILMYRFKLLTTVSAL